MRIGIMLRTFDESGGISIYSRNLIPELLKIDSRNEYVLFYRNPVHLGTHAHHPQVTERHIPGVNKAYWDQIAIPLACWRERLDLVFHPKFTLPLAAPCKSVMVVHGADWFIPEQAQFYSWFDVQYIRAIMPLYFRKASLVLSVSQLTTDNFNRALNLPEGKVKTVYLGPGRHFRRIEEAGRLAEVRALYGLPEKFILTLSKPGGDRRKNFGALLAGYAHYYQQATEPHKLVVGGKDCHLFRDLYEIPSEGYGAHVLFPGWLAQEDLPAIYSLASLYAHPSNLEAFPQPVVEAMATGTPLLTSNANGMEEIAGEAALLVDPRDPLAIGNALIKALSDPAVLHDLAQRGLARAARYSWDHCARETLAALEWVGAHG